MRGITYRYSRIVVGDPPRKALSTDGSALDPKYYNVGAIKPIFGSVDPPSSTPSDSSIGSLGAAVIETTKPQDPSFWITPLGATLGIGGMLYGAFYLLKGMGTSTGKRRFQ